MKEDLMGETCSTDEMGKPKLKRPLRKLGLT
jgi:hypothetical protein